MDIVDFLEDNAPIKLYRLSPLDFKKFIRPKKEFINEELHKLLLKTYYNFIDIFSQKSADMFPPHWLIDYIINLKKNKMPFYKRLYLILKDKLLAIKKYINKHFNKGFISFSMSPIAAPILFAKKLKKGL